MERTTAGCVGGFGGYHVRAGTGRVAATLAAVAMLLIGWIGVAAADAGQPGYISTDGSPVKSAPSVRDGTTKFRANRGESVWIRCQVEDAKAQGLLWFNVLIRDTSGWVVDAARRDPTRPIPTCGDGRAV